jgi:hypothetical protein
VRRFLIPLIALLALAFPSGNALAGGRAMCRAEVGTAFGFRCAVEQSVFTAEFDQFRSFELATGVHWRPLEELAPLPYVALLYTDAWWWAALEVGNNWLRNWYISLGFGIRW